MRLFRQLCGAIVILLLAACTGVPENVRPVESFELERYLGNWYEVARLDHPFERGLDKVTARYSLRPDGGVEVLNRGFSSERGEWQEAIGRAYFAGDPSVGHLKVSFFGPFYASYVVFGLDRENYQYAFVSGPDTTYLWLLSRQPSVDDAVMERFLRQAESLGFNTSSLIYPEQDTP